VVPRTSLDNRKKILDPTGTRHSDPSCRPVHSQSLFQLLLGGGYVFKIMLNMELLLSIQVSVICCFSEVILYICGIILMCWIGGSSIESGRTLNVLPVCPTYFKMQTLHFNWYIPHLLKISVEGFPGVFFFVLAVLCVVHICTFFNTLAMILVSFPEYVKVVFFVLSYLWCDLVWIYFEYVHGVIIISDFTYCSFCSCVWDKCSYG
jgi:hypothetical protein